MKSVSLKYNQLQAASLFINGRSHMVELKVTIGYSGREVPNPLDIYIHRGKGNLVQVMNDIMGKKNPTLKNYEKNQY